MSHPGIYAIALAFALGSASGVAAQGYGQQQQGQGQGQGYGSGQQQRGAPEQSQSRDIGKDQARSMIEAYGYSNVENLKKNGPEYKATAERGGEEVDIVVDARTGAVSEAGS